MYKVSDKYRETIYGGSADNIPYLTINGNEISYEQISKIVISSPIIDTSSEAFYLGSFVSQKLTITFRNTDGIELNGDVYLEIGSKVDLTEEEAQNVTKYVDGYEYVPIGYFIIDTSSEDFYTKSELVCMDRATLFKTNVDYSGSMENGVVTVENLLKWLCDYFGVELGSYPIEHPNLSKTISSVDSTVSGKTYISWIAEMLGSNAKMGRDGKLYIVPLKSDPVVKIDALSGSSWTASEKYIISNVMFDNGTLEKDFEDEEYHVNTQGNTLALRTANLFIQETDFEERVTNIYNSIVGFEVWSITHENVGDPSLDCWDIVTFDLDEKGTYNSFYDNTFTYEMAFSVKVSVSIPTKQVEQTTNVTKTDATTTIKKVYTEVDQLNGTIKEVSTATQTLDKEINDNYQEIISKFDGYVPQNEYVQYTKTMTETLENDRKLYLTKEILTDGEVEVVKNSTTTIDSQGVTIDDDQSQVKNLLSPKGITILDKTSGTDNNELFFAGYDDDLHETIVRTNHINVSKYFTIASLSRMEKYTPSDENTTGVGIFWVGD